jgi:hypothetical protein
MSFCVLKASATVSLSHPRFSIDMVSALLHQSPIRIKDAESAWSGYSSPFAIRRTRKPSVPCDVQFVLLRSRGYEPTHCRLITWAAKSPVTGIGGCNGCQSDLMVFPTPVTVHRCIQCSAKQFLRLKGDVVPHDVIRRTGQLMRKCLVSHHAIGRLCLALIVRASLVIEASGKF